MGEQNRDSRYRKIVEGIDKLPSMPALASKLVSVVNSPESSAEDAAKLIEKDPALTSKIIRLANSAFYGMPRTISSVSSAVVVLGFNTIRSVALSAAIFNMFPRDSNAGSFDYLRFWRHSIVSGMVARLLARRILNFVLIDPEGAFCAAILHDIGKLIFQQYFPEECGAACRLAFEKSIPLIRAEEEIMGITHARIGSILADKWAFPPDLENAIVYHHTPDNAGVCRELACVVHLADAVCHCMQVNLWKGETAPEMAESALKVLEMTKDDFTSLIQSSGDCVMQSGEYFDILN
jgi:putative nucleotidyltransferase with HDIG domain